MNRSMPWIRGALLVFGLAAAGYVLWRLTSTSAGIRVFDTVGLLVAVIGTGAAVLTLRGRARDRAAETSTEAYKESLAREVLKQWSAEADTLGLSRPEPIGVEWRFDEDFSTMDTGASFDEATPRRQTKTGSAATIGRDWAAARPPLTAILGAAGTGKSSTAIMLVHQLLATPGEGDPVPVLLQAVTWNPTEQGLDDWVADRISEEYGRSARLGAKTAKRLLERGELLPVIDGFDEMPSPSREPAFAQIARATCPIVLTCRTDDFAAASTMAGRPISGTVAVVLQPVTPEQAIAYLEGGSQPPGHWSPIAEHIRADPNGALATALSTPLMVHLCSRVYRTAAPDMDVLRRLSRPEDIERLWLSEYIPAQYSDQATILDVERGLRAYDRQQATEWLTFLARHARMTGAAELRWWELHLSSPRWAKHVFGMAVGVAVTFLALLVGSLVSEPSVAVTVGGCVTGLVAWVGTVRAFGNMEIPNHQVFERGDFSVPLRSMVVGVAGVGLLVWPISMTWISWEAALAIVPVWLFFLLVNVAAKEPSDVSVLAMRTPRQTTRDSRSMAVIRVVLAAAFLAALSYLLSTAVRSMTIPASSTFDIVYILFALLIMLYIAGRIITVIARLFGNAWIVYQVARAGILISSPRALPARTIRFLEDAHKRGVLRRIGPAYQFRHARLLEHLDGSTAAPRDLARDEPIG